MSWAKAPLVAALLFAAPAFAQYPVAPDAPPGDSSNKVANTRWVSANPASGSGGSLRLSSYASGVGGDDGAGIQAAVNAAAAASRSLIVDTPAYVDPAGYRAWTVCASPNHDGHGVTLPAGVSILGPGWPVHIEAKPGCASPPSEVVYAPNSTGVSSLYLSNFTIDGYGLAIPLAAPGWFRATLDHMLVRNAAPGSLATFENGVYPSGSAGDLTVVGASRFENVNDSGHTLYWGSRLYADANSGQNQVVLPSIPSGLVPGSAVDMLFANGAQQLCTTVAGSVYAPCVSVASFNPGDRVVIQGGQPIVTTLAANASIGATTVTLATVNGVGPGDPIALAGAGSAGGTLNSTVTGFPASTAAPAGTVTIADAVVTGVSSGAAATVAANFYADVVAVNPVGCSSPCIKLNLPPAASLTNARTTDPTAGYNFSVSGLPNSVAVAYACQVAGTTVSLSTSATDLACASPYNLPFHQIAGLYVTNLPIFTVADAGADSQWANADIVSGAYAEFAGLQNVGDLNVKQIHTFGKPPLNGLYGVEMTGGGICASCQNDKAQWAGIDVGNKAVSVPNNSSVYGFIMAAGTPSATLQQAGVRVWDHAAGAIVQGFRQDTGSTALIPASQIVLQAGVADPTELVRGNPGASFVSDFGNTNEVDPRAFGASSSNPDNSGPINAAVAYAATFATNSLVGATVRIHSPANWTIRNPIVWLPGVSFLLDRDVEILVDSTAPLLDAVVMTGVGAGNRVKEQTWDGGKLDGNLNATHIFDIQDAERIDIRNTFDADVNGSYVELGNASQSATVFEVKFYQNRVDRVSVSAAPSGNYGVASNNASANDEVRDNVFIGTSIPVYGQQADWFVSHNHMWTDPAGSRGNMLACAQITAYGASYTDNECDTGTALLDGVTGANGFVVQATSGSSYTSQFISNRVLTTYGADNKGAAFSVASGANVYAAGNVIECTASHRWANDFSGTLTGIYSLGTPAVSSAGACVVTTLLNSTTPEPFSINGVAAFNAAGTDAASGHSAILFTPPFGGTQTIGVFVRPTLGSLANTGAFWAAYNMAWGNSGTPIPAGTKGQLSGYEANITSAQALADQTDFSHGFGCTCSATSTGKVDGLDLAMTWAGGDGHGINVSTTTTASGGAHYGVYVQSGSSTFPTAANFFSNNASAGAKQDFAAQGQSSRGENDSFAGFAGFGDASFTNPFVLVGNRDNLNGTVGTTSNHPLQIITNNVVAATVGTNGSFAFSGSAPTITPASGQLGFTGGGASLVNASGAGGTLGLRANGATNVVVSSAGVALTGTLSQGGSAGVNCAAGVTAATVVVVNGIVTHC